MVVDIFLGIMSIHGTMERPRIPKLIQRLVTVEKRACEANPTSGCGAAAIGTVREARPDAKRIESSVPARSASESEKSLPRPTTIDGGHGENRAEIDDESMILGTGDSVVRNVQIRYLRCGEFPFSLGNQREVESCLGSGRTRAPSRCFSSGISIPPALSNSR